MLVTREDQLCMLVTRANETEKSVYMATRNESTGALSWTKFLTLLRPDGLRCLHSGMSFLVDQENKVVLSLKKRFQFSSNIIIHIVGEDTNIKVDLHGANTTHTSPAPLLLSYAPSFVQIQQDTSSSLER
ncbi:unnamed protein product [Thlaspi arvense]|uniref:F-box associated beta-propeller type 1 domain-containing protein n=1 Tax=Thlaspi arvense TaxID=13288 RepID=A0AAU9S2E1_THLAR|nr:unnamed protein product [Thlaspi arvense]